MILLSADLVKKLDDTIEFEGFYYNIATILGAVAYGKVTNVSGPPVYVGYELLTRKTKAYREERGRYEENVLRFEHIPPKMDPVSNHKLYQIPSEKFTPGLLPGEVFFNWSIDGLYDLINFATWTSDDHIM